MVANTHVWVVDDDPAIQLIIEQALQGKLGRPVTLHRLNSFAQAQAAITNDARADIILLDNQLGDGQGIDLLPGLFSHLASPTELPVLMVSGDSNQDFLARCFAEGASDYIIKPFNIDLLIHKVNAMLAWKANQDELRANKKRLEALLSEREREEQIALTTYNYFVDKHQLERQGLHRFHQPASAFSGDLLMTRKAQDGRRLYMLCDATGHALAAAITLFPAATIFQEMVDQNQTAEAVVYTLNERLVQQTSPDRFVAAIVIEVDSTHNQVRVWNGGLPDLLVVDHQQGIQTVAASDMALGILPSKRIKAQFRQFKLNDIKQLIFFTDGLPEQENQHGQAIGEDPIYQVAQHAPKQIIAKLKECFQQACPNGDNDDDTSLYVLDIQALTDKQ